MVASGYAWAAVMAALGLTNLIISRYFDLGVVRLSRREGGGSGSAISCLSIDCGPSSDAMHNARQGSCVSLPVAKPAGICEPVANPAGMCEPAPKPIG
jgi:hypothetical protein